MTRLKIRFKETYKGYVKGDEAVFDIGVGEALIKKGIATRVKEIEVSDRSVHGPDLTRGDKALDKTRKEGGMPSRVEDKALPAPKKKAAKKR